MSILLVYYGFIFIDRVRGGSTSRIANFFSTPTQGASGWLLAVGQGGWAGRGARSAERAARGVEAVYRMCIFYKNIIFSMFYSMINREMIKIC